MPLTIPCIWQAFIRVVASSGPIHGGQRSQAHLFDGNKKEISAAQVARCVNNISQMVEQGKKQVQQKALDQMR